MPNGFEITINLIKNLNKMDERNRKTMNKNTQDNVMKREEQNLNESQKPQLNIGAVSGSLPDDNDWVMVYSYFIGWNSGKLTECKILQDVINLLKEKYELRKRQSLLTSVSSSMADKAQMINALTNTMDINKNKLGGYHSLRDSALKKLEGLIESIDI